ncbi:hypothetical protein CO206_11885 [Staphylococcus xylosus]|nr:hypothetical protein CO206_11885 [Staphylococcus xylosus]
MSIYIESIDSFNINEVKNLKIAKKQFHFIETITDCLNEAMKLLINLVLNKYDINTIYLSIVRSNEIARALYEELGFRYTSIDDLNGELIFKYDKH